jgi:hypothetical protein
MSAGGEGFQDLRTPLERTHSLEQGRLFVDVQRSTLTYWNEHLKMVKTLEMARTMALVEAIGAFGVKNAVDKVASLMKKGASTESQIA